MSRIALPTLTTRNFGLKRISESILDEFPNIGDRRKAALLKKFGSVQRMRMATGGADRGGLRVWRQSGGRTEVVPRCAHELAAGTDGSKTVIDRASVLECASLLALSSFARIQSVEAAIAGAIGAESLWFVSNKKFRAP